MERVRLIYEQVEEAKRFLLSGSLLHLRLALILLDNAAELMMYRELQYKFAWYDQWRPVCKSALDEWLRAGLGPKYTEEERKAAEREFEPKARILSLRLGRITRDERQILSACHKFRCEAFHRGHLRAEIMLPVCRLLYLTVAGLTAKLPFKSYAIPGGTLSADNAAFLERFGLKGSLPLSGKEALGQLHQKLVDGIALDAGKFAATLSADLVERIDNTLEGLAYVGEAGDQAEIDHRLQYAQFWREEGAEIGRKEMREPAIGNAFKAWQASGRARFTLAKIDRWRRAALAIARYTNPASVLAHYWGVDKRFTPLEDDVSEAVFQYDEDINMRVHDMRR